MKNLFLILIVLLMASNTYSQSIGEELKAKKALLIIDIQNDYFENGASELAGAEQASEQAQLVLQHFREKNNPIIHIQHISARQDATFFLPNTYGVEIHKNVYPIDEETIVCKSFPNSFRETDLLDKLQKMNISELVIVGMMTHMCIDATTRAAKDYGFYCTIVSDACATKDLIINNQNVSAVNVQNAFLAALSYYYADVVNTQTYLEKF